MEESPGINKNHGHLKLLAPTLVTQLQGHGVYLVLTLSLPERLCILGPPELCAHGTSQIMCRWSDGEEPIHILHRSSFIHCSIRLHLQNISSKISKNWWQLSNQVWGPSECKSLWAAWVTHPRSLICFLGFCLYHWLHLLNLSHWL